MERFLHSHLRLSLDVVRTRRRVRFLLEACLAVQQRLVVDNTNVTAAERSRFIEPARAAGYRVTGYFFDPDPEGSLQRNAQREAGRRVPSAGLLGTLKRLERPSREEGFEDLWRVRIAGAGAFLLSHYP